GRQQSRTISISTTHTTERHKLTQKSLSSSPAKDRKAFETPEWRRRLLGGNRVHNDGIDLFSPQTGSLENIFRPPPHITEKANTGPSKIPDLQGSPSRKVSVTTQDYVEEAQRVMAAIRAQRAKEKSRSGLTSLEESEEEGDRNAAAQGHEVTYQDSTKEDFSR